MNCELPRSTRCAAVVCLVVSLAVPIVLHAQALPKIQEVALPRLNPDISPLAVENQAALLDRLMLGFGRDYSTQYMASLGRNLADATTIYFLRQELQGFVDMWRATGKTAYLDHATSLTLQAIQEATANTTPLILHGRDYRGEWPTFFLPSVVAQTNGHSQLCDYQGCSGFMQVARALHQVNDPTWRQIADFVEQKVLEKWLYHRSSVTQAHLTGGNSFPYLMATLNSGRDVREHFAAICIDLYRLGYRRYPYWDWATLMVDLYLTPRSDPNQTAPHAEAIPNRVPLNWGLLVRTDSQGYVWLSVPHYDPNRWTEVSDTSHANRAAWLAAKAYSEGMIDKSVVEGLINTLRWKIWAPEKGPFYFNNYVDGSDGPMGGLPSGRGGNVWFGWHRLATYDDTLNTLFISMGYDLTSGGPNIPEGAQNRVMINAATCLQAWAARLLASKGQPTRFP